MKITGLEESELGPSVEESELDSFVEESTGPMKKRFAQNDGVWSIGGDTYTVRDST